MRKLAWTSYLIAVTAGMKALFPDTGMYWRRVLSNYRSCEAVKSAFIHLLGKNADIHIQFVALFDFSDRKKFRPVVAFKKKLN
jgi:hypothetical protein